MLAEVLDWKNRYHLCGILMLSTPNVSLGWIGHEQQFMNLDWIQLNNTQYMAQLANAIYQADQVSLGFRIKFTLDKSLKCKSTD